MIRVLTPTILSVAVGKGQQHDFSLFKSSRLLLHPDTLLLPGIAPYLLGYGLITAIDPWLTALNPNRWLLIIVLGIIGLFYTLLSAGFFYAFLCGKEEQALIRQKLTRRKLSVRQVWRIALRLHVKLMFFISIQKVTSVGWVGFISAIAEMNRNPTWLREPRFVGLRYR